MRIHPRMRGDQPAVVARRPVSFAFTPHARGSTPLKLQSLLTKKIYPACAGINLPLGEYDGIKSHLPRLRGDYPWIQCSCNGAKGFNPHVRGSTRRLFTFIGPRFIYPACEGINLFNYVIHYTHVHLPRLRGDHPPQMVARFKENIFTPQARGLPLDTVLL